MATFLTYLFALYFFASSAFLVSISALICLVTAPFDPIRRAVHLFSCSWGYHYFQLNPFWKVDWQGVENIDPRGTYVLVANHQSYFDIMLLYGLHRMFKWVSKDSIFKMPLVGTNMILNQYVFLARGDLKSIKEMMATCRDWLKKGASVMIFPEGTRSPDGEIKDFRDGPFRLAHDCNVPVIPIVVDGTHEILSKSDRKMRFNVDITVRVLEPVSIAQFGGNVRKMRDYVHELMIEQLADIRNGKASGAQVKELARPGS